MKKFSVISTVLGLGIGIFSKDKDLRKVGLGVAGLGIGNMLYKTYKEKKQEYQEQLETCSDILEDSGLNPETLETNILEKEEKKTNENPIKLLYKELLKNPIFEDDMIIPEIFETTTGYSEINWDIRKCLRISKLEKESSVCIRIPVVLNGNKNIHQMKINEAAMREYFGGFFEEIANKFGLDREIKIKEEGYVVVRYYEDDEDTYTYWQELAPSVNDEGEEQPWPVFRAEVLKNISDYKKPSGNPVNYWGPGNKEPEGTIERYEFYLTVKLPILKEGSNRPGLTLVDLVSILKHLVNDEHEIQFADKEEIIRFNNILFLPLDENLGGIYTYTDNQIEKIDL